MTAPITIVFTTSDSWFSKAIRWFTKSEVSHVMLEYDSVAWGERWIAEAGATGVRKVLAKGARKNVIKEYQVQFDIAPALKMASRYFGQQYDYLALPFFAVYLVALRYLRIKIKKPFKNTPGQFCSELIARIFRYSGVAPFDEIDPERVTPDYLLQFCDANPDLFAEIPPKAG